MKKILTFLFLIVLILPAVAEENIHNALYNESTAVYSLENNSWSNEKINENDIVLKKTLIEGTGSHSIFYYEDGTLGFALATNYELIKNGKMIIIDNNLLKYYKMVYENESFRQVELTYNEIMEVFPQAEIFRLSLIDEDNKIWIHKPFMKKRTLLLVNDTEKFFHSLTCKSKNVQDKEIKGLITISRYGVIKFKHFGEYKGKLTFWVR